MVHRAKNVLVAENETLARLSVVDALKDAGFGVIEASNVADALAVLRSKAADISVLFTDINMPGTMDGLELARHAAIHWPWVSLLVASGKVEIRPSELPEKCRFLRKPYSPDHVVIHTMELVDASAA